MTSKLSDFFHAQRAQKFPLKALIGKIQQSLLENIYRIHANPQSCKLLTLTSGNVTTPCNMSTRDLTSSAGLSN